MASLPTEALAKGVVCASAGNDAQGVAYACRKMGVHGTIFMPTTTPNQKIKQVRMFGKDFVNVQLIGDTYDDAFNAAMAYVDTHDSTFVHPFDDKLVMEGQGTVGLEILRDANVKIDYLLMAIGGGGLASVFRSSQAAKPQNQTDWRRTAGVSFYEGVPRRRACDSPHQD